MSVLTSPVGVAVILHHLKGVQRFSVVIPDNNARASDGIVSVYLLMGYFVLSYSLASQVISCNVKGLPSTAHTTIHGSHQGEVSEVS